MKHPGPGQLPAHQVQALPRRRLSDMALLPWFRAESAGSVLHCKPILGTWLSWVVQGITWPLNTASVP